MKNVSLLLVVFIASTSVFKEINALEFKNDEEMPIQGTGESCLLTKFNCKKEANNEENLWLNPLHFRFPDTQLSDTRSITTYFEKIFFSKFYG